MMATVGLPGWLTTDAVASFNCRCTAPNRLVSEPSSAAMASTSGAEIRRVAHRVARTGAMENSPNCRVSDLGTSPCTEAWAESHCSCPEAFLGISILHWYVAPVWVEKTPRPALQWRASARTWAGSSNCTTTDPSSGDSHAKKRPGRALWLSLASPATDGATTARPRMSAVIPR